MNLLDIEAKVFAALHAAEAFFEADPAAKQLATDAKSAIASAKTDAFTAASDGLSAAVEQFLTPTLGPVGAKMAGAEAAQFVIANADKYVTPIEAKIEAALTPEGTAQ